MLFFQKNLAYDRGEQRTNAYDYTDVGSVGKMNRDVFRKLVERDARKACQRKINVVARCDFFKLWPHEPKAHIRHQKPEEQNFQRRKILKQIFCVYKSYSPNKNGKRRKKEAPNFLILFIHKKNIAQSGRPRPSGSVHSAKVLTKNAGSLIIIPLCGKHQFYF